MGKRLIHILIGGLLISLIMFTFFVYFKGKLDVSGKQSFSKVFLEDKASLVLDSIRFDSLGNINKLNYDLGYLTATDPVIFEKHLELMDSVLNGSINYQKNLSFLITDSLSSSFSESNNLDTARFLIDWACAFSDHEKHSNYSVFFAVVADYWFVYCIDSILVKGVVLDNSLKYDFRLKYLQEVLNNYKYNFSIKETKFEKIIKYIHLGKWHYLIVQRFWRSTDFYVKLLVFIPILFVMLGVYKYIFK